MKFMEKKEKQFIYVFDVVPNENNLGKEFIDIIREQNLPVFTYKGFNQDREPVLACKIYSQSKAESKMIEQLIPQEFHYHVIETKSAAVTDRCF